MLREELKYEDYIWVYFPKNKPQPYLKFVDTDWYSLESDNDDYYVWSKQISHLDFQSPFDDGEETEVHVVLEKNALCSGYLEIRSLKDKGGTTSDNFLQKNGINVVEFKSSLNGRKSFLTWSTFCPAIRDAKNGDTRRLGHKYKEFRLISHDAKEVYVINVSSIPFVGSLSKRIEDFGINVRHHIEKNIVVLNEFQSFDTGLFDFGNQVLDLSDWTGMQLLKDVGSLNKKNTSCKFIYDVPNTIKYSPILDELYAGKPWVGIINFITGINIGYGPLVDLIKNESFNKMMKTNVGIFVIGSFQIYWFLQRYYPDNHFEFIDSGLTGEMQLNYIKHCSLIYKLT